MNPACTPALPVCLLLFVAAVAFVSQFFCSGWTCSGDQLNEDCNSVCWQWVLPGHNPTIFQ